MERVTDAVNTIAAHLDTGGLDLCRLVDVEECRGIEVTEARSAHLALGDEPLHAGPELWKVIFITHKLLKSFCYG